MNIIYIILIVLNILFFLIGFIIGRITSNTVAINQNNNYKPFLSQQNNSTSHKTKHQSPVSIDDTKVVVAIKTDGLEKKYQNLGDTKTSSENISESVNKLKSLKK